MTKKVKVKQANAETTTTIIKSVKTVDNIICIFLIFLFTARVGGPHQVHAHSSKIINHISI